MFKGPQRPSIFRDISYLLRRDSAIDLGEEGQVKVEDVPQEAAQFESVISPRQFKVLSSQLEKATLLEPINITSNADIVICVIGVGYVGKELLEGFGAVFNSIGFDVSQPRLDLIAPDFLSFSNVTLTSDVTQLAKGTHYLISVPTTLHQDNTVNANHLLSAISMVSRYARPGATVVIESSVSVGMTRALLTPHADRLHCGMSPERVDPGRVSPTLVEIPKVISGLSPRALESISEIYSQVFNTVVPVSQPEVAEMTKLYENCYRMVNIAYVNEIADACAAHGIDAHEVIDAAATKPFGFQAFRPGLGVGGHCIPVNPYYLLVNNELPILEHAARRMWSRPAKFASDLHLQCLEALKSRGKSRAKGPRVLVVGVAFKPGQSVISCSPGLMFARAMEDLGCDSLMYLDPLVPQHDAEFMGKLESSEFTQEKIEANFDLVAVCMKQTGVEFGTLEGLEKTTVKYF